MLLYQFRMGTNPRRVIIYLSEKGLEIPRYELDYARMEHRSEWYRTINRAGRAPTLVTDEGVSITDSAAIVEYFEEIYPERSMIGSDPLKRAKVRSLERLGTDLVVRAQLWFWNTTTAFPAKEAEPSSETSTKLYHYVGEILEVLENAIGSNQFLAGDTPTIADFTVFPVFQTARERFNLSFGDEFPLLDAWYQNFRRRPSADY